jgi:D-alanyl-D-alanine carboxypeptidase (penicillin-binding protein 5/6)
MNGVRVGGSGKKIARTVLARAAFAGVATLGFALAGFAPVQTEAVSPVMLPQCGQPARTEPRLTTTIPLDVATSAAPPITAHAAVVVDGETGRVLYDLHAHDRLPPASTTKIMTAILALEHGDTGRSVVSDIDARWLKGSSVMGLRPGVVISVQDLLYGLMLPSGNDAAIELAKSVDGSEAAFVDHMNQKAQDLGLQDTHFVNPHGLDNPDHYSSAYDLAALARYAMNNPAFADLVRTRDHQLSPPSGYNLHNGNSLLERYPGADGVKIGWTEVAGWTLVASAERDGHRLFATVLNSQDRDADAAALMDWAFGSYQWLTFSPHTQATLRLAQKWGFGQGLVQSLAACG